MSEQDSLTIETPGNAGEVSVENMRGTFSGVEDNTPVVFDPAKPTVFLAWVPQDIQQAREDFAVMLLKAGYNVLGYQDRYTSEDELREKTEKNIQDSDFAIFLLGGDFGSTLRSDAGVSHLRYQYDVATSKLKLTGAKYKLFFWQQSLEGKLLQGEQQDFINHIQNHLDAGMMFSSVPSGAELIGDLKSFLESEAARVLPNKEYDIAFIANVQDAGDCYQTIEKLGESLKLTTLTVIPESDLDFREEAREKILKSKLAVIYFKESSDWAISFVKQMWKVVGGASSSTPFLLIGEDEPRRNRFIRFRAPQIGLEVVPAADVLSKVEEVYARVKETGRISETIFCPYTGLRPFNEDESIFFKGRERHIDTIMEMMGEEKFVMVTGSSGDGKSSLIYAGVIPSLKGGFLKTSFSKWAVADFRPERQPLRNLSHALSQELRMRNPDAVESALSYGFSALVDLYKKSDLYCDYTSLEWVDGDEETRKQMKRQAANLLILVDQFEEFFTNSENYRDGVASPTAQITINVLIETIRIAREQGLPIYVLFTMRSDFIGQCVAFRGFAELIGSSTYFVPRLKREEIQEVIEAPAFLNGNRLSVRLSQRILNDLGDGIDQLPVLQHALHQIWTEAKQGTEELDLIHYAKVGGLAELKLPRNQVEEYQRWFSKLPDESRQLYLKPKLRNILNRHANELYNNAHIYYNERYEPHVTKEKAQEIIRYAFTGLTKIDENRAVRNRMSLQEITDIIGRDDVDYLMVGRLLNIFREPGNTFVQPYIDPSRPETRELAPNTVLDITHEALIRNWDKLVEWAEREHKRVSIYTDFKVQVNRWLENDCLPKYLLNSGNYNFFNAWYEDTRPTPAWIRRYITPEEIVPELEPMEQAELYLEDIDEFLLLSREKLERQRRIMWFIIVLISALLLLASALAFWANGERIKAIAAQKDALKQKEIAEQQTRQAEIQRQKAVEQERRAKLQQLLAERNKLQAMIQTKIARRERLTADERRRFAEVQQKIAMEQKALAEMQRQEAERQRDRAEVNEKIAREEKQRALEALAEAKRQRNSAYMNESMFQSNQARDEVQSGNPEVGVLLAEYALPETIGDTTDRPYVPEAEAALYNAADKIVNEKPLQLMLGHNNKMIYNRFSPDGTRLITSSWDKTARVWDVATGKELWVLSGHTHIVDRAAFSKDGRYIVTTAEDFTARLWDFERKRSLSVFRGHGNLLTHAAISDDNHRVVTTSLDKTARLYDANTGTKIAVLEGHTDAVLHASFNPQGTRLVTTSRDGSARLWDTESGSLIAVLNGHSAPVTFSTFSNDGTMVVTTSEDGTAIIWNGVTGNIRSRLLGHKAPVLHAAFSPEDNKLVTSSADFTAKVWSTATGKRLGGLEGGVGGHDNVVYYAEFSSDGKYILTSSEDKTSRLWDAQYFTHLATYSGHEGLGYYAVFSPDASKIAMSISRFPQEPKFSVHIFKVLPNRQELIDFVRTNLKKRDLTPKEKEYFYIVDRKKLDADATGLRDTKDGTLLDETDGTELREVDRLDPMQNWQNRPEKHKVKEGETLYSIAKKYGMKVEELRAINNLKSDELRPGQRILLK
ncbi:MAG: LysM peptidoglycan-binding domain-containing protein [Bacteroidetes bacterium]|nr:LysM peptidoglycan-binding domain-containing protein [Bacteroidota bacterium]